MAAAEASSCKTLVEVYSFDPERAAVAVRSVPDPSDIVACVNWLLDSGEPDRGGPVAPTQLCPHLHTLDLPRLVPAELFEAPVCSQCNVDGTTWLCLGCGLCFCGRYAPYAHGLAHWREAPAHCVALGLSDLSVWCHECAAYVKHERLEPLLRLAQRAKFGGSQVSPPPTMLPPLQNCTALLYDSQTARHAPPVPDGPPKWYERAAALECPQRTRAVLDVLSERGLAARCVALTPPGCAARVDLERVHSPEYIAAVAARSGGEPFPRRIAHPHTDAASSDPTAVSPDDDDDDDNQASVDEDGASDFYLVDGTAEAASRAASCAVALALALQAGSVANGFALVRPPGHHARRDRAAGCCIFNSVGVAALAALAADKDARVMVLDWDVHHGDGLQEILWDEPRALYCSIHAIEPIKGGRFPEAGEAHRVGGTPAGSNVNVALPYDEAGHGDGAFAHALDALVLPIARQFVPTLVLVAAGFDAAVSDPCGARFCMTPSGYAYLTRRLLAPTLPSAHGRVGLVLEGGYAPASLAECVAACVGALLGDEEQPLAQPLDPAAAASPRASPGAIAAVEETRLAHEPFWSCLRR